MITACTHESDIRGITILIINIEMLLVYYYICGESTPCLDTQYALIIGDILIIPFPSLILGDNFL